MASIAYSTWKIRPSGENVLTPRSYSVLYENKTQAREIVSVYSFHTQELLFMQLLGIILLSPSLFSITRRTHLFWNILRCCLLLCLVFFLFVVIPPPGDRSDIFSAYCD